jgi:hypothetical protein
VHGIRLVGLGTLVQEGQALPLLPLLVQTVVLQPVVLQEQLFGADTRAHTTTLLLARMLMLSASCRLGNDKDQLIKP